MRMSSKVTLNGRPVRLDHEAGSSLLTAVRAAGVVGPKRGCEAGDCGCCTVWVDDDAVQSCLFPAWRAAGRRVTTIEGLAVESAPTLHPMQHAFLAEEGFQCGYCTAGMIMTLAASNTPTDASEAVRTKGNICRCTGWSSIRRAMAAEGADGASGDDGGPHGRHASPTDGEDATEPVPGAVMGVGSSAPNRHGPSIVTGRPSFTSDFHAEFGAALLHIAAVRAPHAHAMVRSVDASAARAMEGVVDVFWHEHVPRRPYTTACHPADPRDAFDTYLLDDHVRFAGQRVVIVVAESVEAARRAAGHVQVDYEVLPAVTEPEEAVAPGAPVIHPEEESTQIADRHRNLIGEISYRRGDVNSALREASYTVALTFHTPRQQHTHLEPHSATAWVEEDGSVRGRLVVRASTQVPALARRTLARVLDRPEDSIRVFKPRVGGGFGNKQEVLCEDIVAFAAERLRRPVSWEFSRWEEFAATNTRHSMTLTVRAGAGRDGRLTALSLDVLANGGAYGNHSYDVLECGAFEALSLYACPNKATRGRAVYTNTVPAGAFRGYGAAQTTFAVDSALDELARKIGIDPWEFRRASMVTASSPLTVGEAEDADHKVGSYALDRCQDHVRRRLNELTSDLPTNDGEGDYARRGDQRWEGRRRGDHARREDHRRGDGLTDRFRYGQGFAVSTVGSGLANIHVSGAVLNLTTNGFLLQTSTADIGTGSDTTLAQIAAEALGVDFGAIDVASGDTSAPEDSGAYASATAYIAGKAVFLAAQRLRERVIDAAAALLDCRRPEVAMGPLGVHVVRESGAERDGDADDPTVPRLTYPDLARRAGRAGFDLTGRVERFTQKRVSMSFAVVGVVVRVDEATGRVELLHTVQAVDAGRIINPRIARSQAEGATVQSLGYALSENLVVDEHGVVVNPTFRDYRVPGIGDVGEMETMFFETEDDAGPFGAKALGELTTTAAPAAVANAVRDALGVRFTSLPITAEACHRAMVEGAL